MIVSIDNFKGLILVTSTREAPFGKFLCLWEISRVGKHRETETRLQPGKGLGRRNQRMSRRRRLSCGGSDN